MRENIDDFSLTSVVVEKVNAMPGQGVTSMFNFGQTFGAIKGICAALGLPIFFVTPSKWKNISILLILLKMQVEQKPLKCILYYLINYPKKRTLISPMLFLLLDILVKQDLKKTQK